MSAFTRKVFETYVLLERRQDKEALAHVVAHKMTELLDSGQAGFFPKDLDQMYEDTWPGVLMISSIKTNKNDLMSFLHLLKEAVENQKALLSKTT